MKFGSTIKNSLYSEWLQHYIDYSGLKKFVKNRQKAHPWDDSDEADFIKALQSELTKVAKFQEAKVSELTEQIGLYEVTVKELIEAHAHNHSALTATTRSSTTSDEGANQGGPDGPVGYGDVEADLSDDEDEEDVELEQRFSELEEDLETLIADVHDLGRFTQLNYTGFVKIVKKHDKRTGWELRGEFMREYLSKRPFYKENYDALIVQLSKLYNLVRTRGNPVIGDSSAGGSQSAFVRQTTKYWVHPDNYVNLKLAILKHLPVLVFDPEKPFEQSDAAISSIYFDNEDLELYLGRLEKSEGAEAIRLRWYGPASNRQIFVERKTHHEDWTGEKSVKARFPIKEEFVNSYLNGSYSMDDTFNELRKKGKKSDKEVDSMIKLAREVQIAVKNKKLGPVMRTFYNRTAFQLPGDARVRISFDTQMSGVREDNWDGRVRSGDNWRRTDIGIDWPFEQLPEDDKHLFPYGVLEVKLQTQMGQEPPEWVRELVSSHLVEAVPKYSKFIHCCATLIPNRVDLVPFWLPQMDVDIRKPSDDHHKAAMIERPSHPGSSASASAQNSDGRKSPETKPPSYTEPVSEDEDDEDGDPMRQVANNEHDATGLPPDAHAAAAEAKAAREKSQKGGATGNSLAPPPQRTRSSTENNSSFAKLTPQNLQRVLATKYGQEESTPADTDDPVAEPNLRRVEYVSSFRDMTGKRIAVPVRIEPKVQFALERTFLSWLEFAVLLSAIGVGLLSFAHPDDSTALIGGIVFTAIALIAIAYAGVIFLVRAFRIRRRAAVSYHDYVGPTALCIALFAGVVLNFALRIHADEDDKPVHPNLNFTQHY